MDVLTIQWPVKYLGWPGQHNPSLSHVPDGVTLFVEKEFWKIRSQEQFSRSGEIILSIITQKRVHFREVDRPLSRTECSIERIGKLTARWKTPIIVLITLIHVIISLLTRNSPPPLLWRPIVFV